MLGIIAALIVVIYLQSRRLREMRNFRQSVRHMTVVAEAKDADTGAFLPCHVSFSDSGEDLESSSSAWSDHGQMVCWLTTKSKTIAVTSPGYSTQSFVVPSSWTNVLAHLHKLDNPPHKDIHGTGEDLAVPE
ncbi:MAG: hypothetical protein KDM81_00190 [Verrucomicrobiae bacterium]|nr:hypothetical protein [Verrucomicrobiae bacterium]